MSSVMPSISSNYAEQVLREEAERLKRRDEAAAAASAASKTTKSFNEIHEATSTIMAKVNLKDDNDFPTLGNAKVASAPIWSNSKAIPPPAPVAAKEKIATGSSSVRFLLPQGHQRKDSNLSAIVNSTCARLMKETGATIEVSISSQTGGISFVVSGKSENVKSIKRQLWSTLAQNGTIEFEVPEECLRFIIGPSGKVLKEIEGGCAVKVKIPRNEDWTGSIMISGDFEGVAMARDRILSIVQERANKASIQMEIDRTLAPFLWEKKLSGISLTELAESFPLIKINLNKNEDSAHLNLFGDRSQIELVEARVLDALNLLRSTIKSVSTSVPKPLHRLLIGPKGATLHQLEEQTGCGIFIPSAKDSSEQVTIYGSEDELLSGLSALMDRVKGLASEKVSVPEIPFKLLQSVQKYRSELKALSDANSITSLHCNYQERCIELEGKKDNVLGFLSQFKELLIQLSEFKTIESLELDQGYLKHVIGRKGQNLQQIQKDFDVEIIIEDDDETVSFIGKTPESVSNAKNQINSIISSVADVLSVSLNIDSKYHGFLIGAKGSNLTKYLEKYPSVMINFSDSKDTNNNSVRIKGSREEVEACQAELIAQADSIRHEMIMNSYTQSIKLTPEDRGLLQKSPRDCSFLTNFIRQQDCKLTIDLEASEMTIQGLKKTVDSVLPLLTDRLELIKDRDSLTFTVDPQYHGILIGSEGRNLKHLVQKYSVKIDFPRKTVTDTTTGDITEDEHHDEASNCIKVTGPKKNISKARDELLDLLKYHLENENEEIIQVPSKFVASIIGKGGVSINSVKLESDCNIDFLTGDKANGKSSTSTSEIKLHGSKAAISCAKKLLNELVSELADQLEVPVVLSSSDLLKSLSYGPFKREYRKLTSKYEQNVNFYPRDSKINVKGRKEFVDCAVTELKSLIESIESGVLIESEVMVPSRLHGKILGSGGSNIKELIREFDCEIQVPRPGQSGPIKIVGHADKVQKCSEKIKSYGVEERFFNFPSEAWKISVLQSLCMKEEGEVIDQIAWFFSNKSNGIRLIGDVDLIEKFKERLNASLLEQEKKQ